MWNFCRLIDHLSDSKKCRLASECKCAFTATLILALVWYMIRALLKLIAPPAKINIWILRHLIFRIQKQTNNSSNPSLVVSYSSKKKRRSDFRVPTWLGTQHSSPFEFWVRIPGALLISTRTRDLVVRDHLDTADPMHHPSGSKLEWIIVTTTTQVQAQADTFPRRVKCGVKSNKDCQEEVYSYSESQLRTWSGLWS